MADKYDVFVAVGRGNAAGAFMEARTIIASDSPGAAVDGMWRATDGVEWALLVAAYHGHTETRLQSASIFLALAKRAREKAIRREHGAISAAIDSLRTGEIADRKCFYCKTKEDLIQTVSGKWICRSCNEEWARMEPDMAEAVISE
jgi:ribosomal protein L37AE/L43A